MVASLRVAVAEVVLLHPLTLSTFCEVVCVHVDELFVVVTHKNAFKAALHTVIIICFVTILLPLFNTTSAAELCYDFICIYVRIW